MAGSYFAHGGVEHARTMLRHSEDSRKFATLMVVVFGLVFGYGLTLFILTSASAYLFTISFGLTLMLWGVHLRIRHGKQIEHWSGKLADWEALRRDRAIHARRLEPWEL